MTLLEHGPRPFAIEQIYAAVVQAEMWRRCARPPAFIQSSTFLA